MKKVKDIMRTGIPTIKLNTPIKEIIAVMEKHISFGLAIEDQGKIVGIITDGDLMSAYGRILNSFSYEEEKSNESWKKRIEAFREWKAQDIMTHHPRTVNENADISEAASIIKKFKFRRLVAVDNNGKYAGLVTRVAIMKSALE